MPGARILIVDDERSMREFLDILFRQEGYEVTTADGVASARLALDADDYDVVITDVQMPDGNGLEVLRWVKGHTPDTVVVMITAFATAETAIEAMKQGAYDYINKPFKTDEVRLIIEKALEKRELSSENERLRSELRREKRQRNMVGTSDAMQAVYDLVAQVAGTKTNVLIAGESGTGKELVARAIHDQSGRADEAFIAVNCGAIPENLLESELFGHAKGAFTGAVDHKPGLFEAASKGTLFLDEIGEMPAPLQVKLLRAIQERQIRRVGSSEDVSVDVRIVAATNRELRSEVAQGRFREDLYYRLNVIQIAIPPLRERMEDVPLLIQHFAEKYAADMGRPAPNFSAAALQRIEAYSFPGNVRELENTIERAVALSREDLADVDVLPAAVLEPVESLGAGSGAPLDLPTEGADLEDLVNRYERSLLRQALRRTGGVKKRAAALLGVSFRSFRYRLEKLGLEDDSSQSD